MRLRLFNLRDSQAVTEQSLRTNKTTIFMMCTAWYKRWKRYHIVYPVCEVKNLIKHMSIFVACNFISNPCLARNYHSTYSKKTTLELASQNMAVQGIMLFKIFDWTMVYNNVYSIIGWL